MQTDTSLKSAKGTISRVSANSLIYVIVDGSGEQSVSFTPAAVQGYAGQELKQFGFVPGRRVQLSWNPDSSVVGTVKLEI